MKNIFIIVLNWNGKKDTIACLKSLEKLSIVNFQLSVILVDNGSTDRSVEAIKSETYRPSDERSEQELVIIQNPKNLGFAEGNNVGIKYAMENGGDYVVLLNNDTLVDTNLVTEIVKVAESDRKFGVISPKIYFAAGFEFHRARYRKKELGKVIWYAGGKMDWRNVLGSHRGVDRVDHGQYNTQTETDFATGCCLLIKKEVLLNIGLLDGKYFSYYEDADFCQRAKRAGFKVVYAPKGILWHKNASSSGKPGSSFHEYYQTRNRLLFASRYAPLRSKFALFRESLGFILKNKVKRQAVLDFYFGRLGKGSFE